jgi:perosamine synthetase
LKKIIPVNRPSFSNIEKSYLLDCINTGWISSSGKYIPKFENEFKKIVNRKYSAAVSSGTAALDIAIKSLNLKKGDEIIVPNFTIISCVNEMIREGVKPIFIEADPNTFNIDVDKIESKITKKTKAILIAHIYGLPVDLKKIIKLKKKYNLFVIEDCAEQLGQTYYKKPIGSFGDISTFSFFANKHITTGEGGMIVTNNKIFYRRFLEYRNICFSLSKPRFIHEDIGWNYRITNLQAAIGCAQLKKLKKFIRKKRLIGKMYTEELKNFKNIKLPIKSTEYSKNIYWVYSIIIKNKKIDAKRFMKILKSRGIDSRPFFCPMHMQPILKKNKLITKEKYPISEEIYKYGFYIPSGIGNTFSEIKIVIRNIKEILNNNFA